MPESDVVGMEWDDFLEWFKARWNPGDHLSICALTKAGKSTFAGGVLQLRKYVAALDAKGGDDILNALKWPRLEAWPGPKKLRKRMTDDEQHSRPTRYVFGPLVKSMDDDPRLAKVLEDSIKGLFEMGGFTVYFDELQVTSDRRMLDLSPRVARLLVAARQPKKITVVSSYQAPTWVPSEANRQPWWFAIAATRDEDMVQRLAQAIGRDWHELLGAMRGLEEHTFIVFDRSPFHPMIVTKPRKIA